MIQVFNLYPGIFVPPFVDTNCGKLVLHIHNGAAIRIQRHMSYVLFVRAELRPTLGVTGYPE